MEFIERVVRSGRGAILFRENFFSQCPNCKQSFQGDVFYDLTKAQLSFIEREFKDVECWNLEALMRRIAALDVTKEADRIEGEEISVKILSVIEDDMGNSKPSLEFRTLTMAYKFLGMFYFNVDNDKSLKKAKYYYEKARDVYNTLGDREVESFDFFTKELDNALAKVEARINGDSPPKTVEMLSSMREGYKFLLQHKGEHDIDTIEFGVNLAKALFRTYHTIEALRLLDKLFVTSRRVHGASHSHTKSAESLWQRLKIRCVVIEKQPYQALRYERDGNSYVVNGPMNMSNLDGFLGSLADRTSFSVPCADIVFTRSLPVMLHGLKKVAHLNDEIGDIRDYCKLSKRWVVHLERKGLKPVKVKQENLRILFNLPDPKKESGSPCLD